MRDNRDSSRPKDFSLHDSVHVLPLDKRGTIVGREGSDCYKVEVDGKVIELDRTKLRSWNRAEPASNVGMLRPGVTFHGQIEGYGLNTSGSIDIHGMRCEEALQFIDRVIDQALLQGTTRLTIIHGIGSGTLKRAVHEHLSRLIKDKVIEQFQLNHNNPGETKLFL